MKDSDSFPTGRGNRIPLGDVSNSNGKRGLPLVPGKFIIGRRAGVVKNPPDSGGSLRPDSPKRSRKMSPGNGEERDPSDRDWKIWNLIERCKGRSVDNLQRSGMEDAADVATPVGEARTDVNRGSVKTGAKGKFPSALNPGLHFIKGGVAARGGPGSEQLGKMVRAEKAPGASPEEKDEVDGKQDLVDVAGPDGNCKYSSGMSLDTADCIDNDGNDGKTSSRKVSLCLDNLCPESIGEPSGHGGLDLEGNRNEDSTMDPGSFSDSGRLCCCYICLKASWLLTDVLSQDYGGRLGEVKKSRKAAGALVGRSFIQDPTGHMPEKFNKFTKLEFDTMQQWRSLLLCTESAFLREGTQLQASLRKLNDLRTKFERDFQTFTGLPACSLYSTSHNSG